MLTSFPSRSTSAASTAPPAAGPTGPPCGRTSSPSARWPNAHDTLTKGTTVTVTGTAVDNSSTPEGSGRVVRRTQVEAADIAVRLRAITAVVTRTSRSCDGQPDTAPVADAPVTDAPGR